MQETEGRADSQTPARRGRLLGLRHTTRIFYVSDMPVGLLHQDVATSERLLSFAVSPAFRGVSLANALARLDSEVPFQPSTILVSCLCSAGGWAAARR